MARRRNRVSAVTRAAELAEFLEAVALGERPATDAQIAQAEAELDELLPDVEPKDGAI